MTSKDLVFCMCCSKRIPRRCEHEHHIKAHKLPTTPTPHKHPRLAFKAACTPHDKPELKKTPKPNCDVLDQDQDMHTTDPGPDMFPIDVEFPGPSTLNHDTHHNGQEDGTQDDTDQILTTCIAQRWTKWLDPSCLQSQPDEDLDKPEQDADAGDDCNTLDIPLEDGLSSDDSDYGLIDRDTSQDKSNQQYDLIHDELGEEFESRYAMIGASHFVFLQALTKLMIFLLAKKLDEGDHTICRAFAFKVSTYMADAAWKRAPLVFQTTPPLPTLPKFRSRISFLAGFSAQTYNCCLNLCVCYTGPHTHATSCTYCGLSRLDITQAGSLVRSSHTSLSSFGYRHFVPTIKLRQLCSIDVSLSLALFQELSRISSMARTTRRSNQNASKLTRLCSKTSTLMTIVTSRWACLLMGLRCLTDGRVPLGQSSYSTTISLRKYDSTSAKSLLSASFQAPRSHKTSTHSCGLSSRSSFLLLVESIRLMLSVAPSSPYVLTWSLYLVTYQQSLWSCRWNSVKKKSQLAVEKIGL